MHKTAARSQTLTASTRNSWSIAKSSSSTSPTTPCHQAITKRTRILPRFDQRKPEEGHWAKNGWKTALLSCALTSWSPANSNGGVFRTKLRTTSWRQSEGYSPISIDKSSVGWTDGSEWPWRTFVPLRQKPNSNWTRSARKEISGEPKRTIRQYGEGW